MTRKAIKPAKAYKLFFLYTKHVILGQSHCYWHCEVNSAYSKGRYGLSKKIPSLMSKAFDKQDNCMNMGHKIHMLL